jgi:uncharacterized membrane protein YidH (DUF202 family)
MEWNRNEWQGRSKEQVDRNNKVFGLSIIISFVVTTGLLIFYLLSL